MPFRKSKPPRDTGRVDDPWTTLTLERLDAELKIKRRARKLAIKGQPGHRDTGLSAVETEVLDAVRSRVDARNADIQASVAAISEQLISLDPNPEHAPGALHQKAIDTLTGTLTARAPTIRKTLETEKRASAELNDFRAEHDIDRQATYAWSKLNHYRWVGVAAIGEAVAQSSMLLSATPDGLVGAIGLALCISAVTTGLGLVIGFAALRFLFAPSPATRVIGWAALTALSPLLLSVALYLAHFRDVARATGGSFDDAQVMQHLLAQPFDVSGPGWLLMLLTLACAAFAATKSFTAGDPIPGYEKVDRAHVDALERRDYLRADIQGAIVGIKAHFAAPLLNQPKLAGARRDIFLRSYADLQARHQKAIALAQQEAELALRSITAFRNVNLATRADGVRPAYFSANPAIQFTVDPLPVDVHDRIEAAMARVMTDASRTADHGLRISRLLDQTSDRVDELMIAIDRADIPSGENPLRDFRSTLEAAISTPSLPAPDAKPAGPDLPATKT